MVKSQKCFEEAMVVQTEILPDCKELSIGLVRRRSPDSALIMAEYMYRHIIENSESGTEFANMLKELEAFNREDKIKAIGFFYESLEANKVNRASDWLDFSILEDIAKWWKLGDKFEILMKAFFTEIPPTEEEKVVKEKVVEEQIEEEVILVPEFKKKK